MTDCEQSLKDLLVEWKLDHLFNQFQRDGIDLDCLNVLTSEHIKNICVNLGDQIKLQHHLQNRKTSLLSSSRLDKENVTSPAKKRGTSSPLSPSKDTNSSAHEKRSKPDWFSKKSHPSTGEKEPPQKIKRFCLAFDLTDLFERDIYARGIVSYFSKEASLTEHYRSYLTNCVVKELFFHYGRITSQMFEGQLLEIFYSEKRALWYEPPSEGNGLVEAAGCLYYRAKSLRGELVRMGVLEPLRHNKPKSITESNAQDTNEDLKSKIEILCSDNALTLAEEDLESLWEYTREYRLSLWTKPISCKDTIDTFKVFCHPHLPALLRSDFEKVYPNANAEDLKERWHSFVKKLLIGIQKKKKKNLLVPNFDLLSEDSKQAILLKSITACWPFSVKTKKSIKLSASKVSDSFIFLVDTEINNPRSTQVDDSFLPDLEPRPIIYCFGSTLENISKVAIGVGELTIAVESIFEAIQLGYHLQIILKGAPYSDTSNYLWTLLDRAVFKCNFFQKRNSKVTQILADLKISE